MAFTFATVPSFYSVDLSRVVFHRIKFNFAWALVYNCIAVPISDREQWENVHLDPV
ncbi:hypothetical protein AtubIFM55763_001109 [Aspergillus tubingensis]|nr:hypothetical protein AtubIFM55763_001109 [Aspergillus tubingensis]